MTKSTVTPRTLRIPFVRRCTVTTERGEERGLLIDLSVTGAYVQTDRLLDEGQEVLVKFRVPGNDRLLELQAVVAWHNLNQKHPVHSLPPGSGLRFIRLGVEDTMLIVETIRNYCQSNPLYRRYL